MKGAYLYMKDIKIVFFDIDGTLINIGKKSISENVHFALVKLKENGIKICIATGRSPVQLPKFPGIAFDAYLTYNGSYCFTHDEDIFRNPLQKEDVFTIIENTKRMGRPVSLATKNRLVSNGSDADLKAYYQFGGNELTVSADFDRVADTEDIYQMLSGGRKEEYASILKDTKAARITAWWDRAVDIIPANGGKGMAITKILDYFHLTKEEAMAFGDGNNDIEMLETVGRGVAMQNASNELKAVADDFCDDVANDGVYTYCKEHGLI